MDDHGAVVEDGRRVVLFQAVDDEDPVQARELRRDRCGDGGRVARPHLDGLPEVAVEDLGVAVEEGGVGEAADAGGDQLVAAADVVAHVVVGAQRAVVVLVQHDHLDEPRLDERLRPWLEGGGDGDVDVDARGGVGQQYGGRVVG